MISFEDVSKLFSIDLKNSFCIEIDFRVVGMSDLQNCWMGKLPDSSDAGKEIYWFGLAKDGSKAYDFDNFDGFSAAPVFNGKSLKEVWDDVELISVDGCDPESRIADLLELPRS